MRQDEARELILKEYDTWVLREHPNGIPSGTEAMVFYAQFKEKRPDMFAFRSSADKWQVFHSWLLHTKRCRD